jgi:hypothetical protein
MELSHRVSKGIVYSRVGPLRFRSVTHWSNPVKQRLSRLCSCAPAFRFGHVSNSPHGTKQTDGRLVKAEGAMDDQALS